MEFKIPIWHRDIACCYQAGRCMPQYRIIRDNGVIYQVAGVGHAKFSDGRVNGYSS